MIATAFAARVDAGGKVGRGHLSRAAAVAEAIVEGGGRALIAGRIGVVPDGSGVAVRAFTGAPSFALPADDADALADAARGCDWILLDHYGIDGAYVARLRAAVPGARLAAFVDHLAAPWADLRIAPAEDAADPATLAALDHAVLRPAFWLARCAAGDRRGVVVAMGAADHDGLAARVLDALPPDASATVVADDATARRHGLDERLARRVGARRVAGLDAAGIAALFAGADAVIASASTSALEAAAVGARVVALPWTDNQRPLAAALARAGVVVADTAERAAGLIGDARRIDGIDGLGAWRVAAAMGFPVTVPIPPQGDAPITLRPVDDRDRAAVWLLNTLADARRVSFDPRPIAWRDHVAWWARRRGDALLAVAGAIPVGFARRDEAGAVGVVVHPSARGRGVAAALMARLVAGSPTPLTAEIRRGNAASERLFAAAGFVPEPIAATSDRLIMRHPGGRSG